MANKIELGSVEILNPEEKFLIDANILLKILIYPSLFKGEKNPYDVFWEEAIENDLKLFVTPLTISEFVNVICRENYKTFLDLKGLKSSYYGFKHNYQNTEEFKIVYEECLNVVNSDILPYVEVINADKQILKSLYKNSTLMKDYNDLIYYSLALEQDLSIITHDSDFLKINEDIRIYTYL